MSHLLVLLAVIGLVAWILRAAARAGVVFRIRVRRGELRAVRGPIRPREVEAIAAVARHARIERAEILGVREGGRIRLVVRGVDEGTAQRLRNAYAAAA